MSCCRRRPTSRSTTSPCPTAPTSPSRPRRRHRPGRREPHQRRGGGRARRPPGVRRPARRPVRPVERTAARRVLMPDGVRRLGGRRRPPGTSCSSVTCGPARPTGGPAWWPRPQSGRGDRRRPGAGAPLRGARLDRPLSLLTPATPATINSIFGESDRLVATGGRAPASRRRRGPGPASTARPSRLGRPGRGADGGGHRPRPAPGRRDDGEGPVAGGRSVAASPPTCSRPDALSDLAGGATLQRRPRRGLGRSERRRRAGQRYRVGSSVSRSGPGTDAWYRRPGGPGPRPGGEDVAVVTELRRFALRRRPRPRPARRPASSPRAPTDARATAGRRAHDLRHVRLAAAAARDGRSSSTSWSTAARNGAAAARVPEPWLVWRADRDRRGPRPPAVDDVPTFVWDLPPGPTTDRLAAVVEMRALLELVTVRSHQIVLGVVDGDDKTQARVVIDRPELVATAAPPTHVEGAALTTVVEVAARSAATSGPRAEIARAAGRPGRAAPVAGRPRRRSAARPWGSAPARTARSCRSASTRRRARSTPVVAVLSTPVRHDAGQRGGHPHRHRLGVPARLPGGGAAHPVGAGHGRRA